MRGISSLAKDRLASQEGQADIGIVLARRKLLKNILFLAFL
jgi:hypothetical protein